MLLAVTTTISFVIFQQNNHFLGEAARQFGAMLERIDFVTTRYFASFASSSLKLHKNSLFFKTIQKINSLNIELGTTSNVPISLLHELCSTRESLFIAASMTNVCLFDCLLFFCFWNSLILFFSQ